MKDEFTIEATEDDLSTLHALAVEQMRLENEVEKKEKELISAIVQRVLLYKFQGVNIDFEGLNETTDEYLIDFATLTDMHCNMLNILKIFYLG